MSRSDIRDSMVALRPQSLRSPLLPENQCVTRDWADWRCVIGR